MCFGQLNEEIIDLSRKVTYWRSVAAGLAVGFLLTNGAWLWFCLKVLLKDKP